MIMQDNYDTLGFECSKFRVEPYEADEVLFMRGEGRSGRFSARVHMQALLYYLIAYRSIYGVKGLEIYACHADEDYTHKVFQERDGRPDLVRYYKVTIGGAI